MLRHSHNSAKSGALLEGRERVLCLQVPCFATNGSSPSTGGVDEHNAILRYGDAKICARSLCEQV